MGFLLLALNNISLIYSIEAKTRNVLGDMMSLIHEYAKNKEEKAENRPTENQLKSGLKAEFIAKTNDISLTRVKRVEVTLKIKKSYISANAKHY